MKRLRLVLLATVLCLAGCTDKSDGLTPEQSATGSKQKEIVQRTGGDWNKLTEADRSYLLGLTHGNERVARMKFETMSGHPPQIGPGAAPAGGPAPK